MLRERVVLQMNVSSLSHSIGSCLRFRILRSFFCTLTESDTQLLSSNLKLKSLCNSEGINDARLLFDKMPVKDEYSWNTMITGYVRSAHLPDALHLFSISPYRNLTTISWSFLMAAHTKVGGGQEAIKLFRRMLMEGPRPDRYTLGSALRACAADFYPQTGRQIHALTIKSLFGDNGFVLAGLVDMYAKCQCITEASHLFNSIPTADRMNHVLWAAMITGHAQNGETTSALNLFKVMRMEGVAPNQFVLPSVLAACAAELAHEVGIQVHAFVIRAGFDSNDFVQCAVIDMYAKCGYFVTAKKTLESTNSYNDSIAWNSLLVGCAKHGREFEALSLFSNMHRRSLEMDEFTYSSIVSVVASTGLTDTGLSIHGMIVKSGYDQNHHHVSNALIDMYSKFGRLNQACELFDGMKFRDVVAWTSLFTGFARHVSNEKALELFREMRAEGVRSDEFVQAAVLSSCGGMATLGLGQQVHAISVRVGFECFVTVANSTLTMYAKCGCVEESWRVFDSISIKDAITWTALIVGCAQNGRGKDSVRIYESMLRSGLRPDYVTFIGLLFACSHAGLVDEGKIHFESMREVHGVTPGPEHYASMIDLLGRAGRIDEAAEMVKSVYTSTVVWKALLSACRVHKDIGLAEKAAEKLLELEPNDAVPYVLLSNIYSTARRWSDTARVRKLMRLRGVCKEPGCSWMEEKREVHVFRAGEAEHTRVAEVYVKVEEMMGRIREIGYEEDGHWTMHEEEEAGDEDGKVGSLKYHSEKLAVAFGLLVGGPQEKSIRVYKNLRVCGDCHTAIKCVSKVYERKIVLRDSNCFHHFVDGVCSCGDYW